ncbi:MAG: hypothetical protein AAF708_13775 [Deinococcota bacterium]
MPEILKQYEPKEDMNWRLKLLEEVSLLPETSLKDMYHLVHRYRLGLDAEEANDLQRSKEVTLSLAGAWQDWDDNDFQAFLDDIYRRRSQNSRRERHEGMFD